MRMGDVEQKRKGRLARRKVAQQLKLYFAGLHIENNFQPLLDRVKQMLLEKDLQASLHV
jgi:hypothetical protein